MCVLGVDITAPPVPGSVASYTFNLQPGRSRSLRAMSVFSSLIHAGHEQDSAADVFVFPSRIKKRNHRRGHSRSRAQNFSQPTVASTCKGLRLSNIQMTGCMLVDLVQDARKRGCGVFTIRWRAWQKCSNPMHPSDHRIIGREWCKWCQL